MSGYKYYAEGARLLKSASRPHGSFCVKQQHVMQSEIYWQLSYSETSLLRHSMEPKNIIGLGGCQITEYLSPYFNMVTVPHKMVELEIMSDYRGFTVLAQCHTGRQIYYLVQITILRLGLLNIVCI